MFLVKRFKELVPQLRRNLNSSISCTCIFLAATEGFKNANSKSDETAAVWHIVVSFISGVVVCIFIFFIVRRSRLLKRRRDAKPQKTDDSIYQELDLTKMNAEDNYQSLTGKAARINKVVDEDYENIDLATENHHHYQDLDLTKMNKEDNYQSLRDTTAKMNHVGDDDYQDLDVTNMNTEDNYQSLTGSAGARINYFADDDNSTYTQLNQFRDDENNYQSLI